MKFDIGDLISTNTTGFITYLGDYFLVIDEFYSIHIETGFLCVIDPDDYLVTDIFKGINI